MKSQIVPAAGMSACAAANTPAAMPGVRLLHWVRRLRMRLRIYTGNEDNLRSSDSIRERRGMQMA